jgi:ATP-binding cassette, subfamily B, bacterial PglK
LIEELKDVSPIDSVTDEVDIIHSDFNPEFELRDVTFKYPNSEGPAIKNISLSVLPGKVVAIVGRSGAGKTTLVDLMLGVLEPSSGEIRISGLEPRHAISKWSGAIGYVPQDVIISNGTIRENIGMGFPRTSVTDDLVNSAVKISQLQDFVQSLTFGVEASVGDRGTGLSGGQRQRLGIARAMFTQPRLLILDEATSSLDGETEAAVTEAINTLKGNVTVVLIAHRLSTVRQADVVIYLQDGMLIAEGSFEEVRKSVPDFDYQAKLMGL